jgi:hypothetical protein
MAQFAPTYMGVYDSDTTGTLVDLTLSASSIATAAAVLNATVGNVVGRQDARNTLTVLTGSDKFRIDGLALKVNVTGPIAAGSYPISIREEGQYAGNSPRVTNLTITVTA